MWGSLVADRLKILQIVSGRDLNGALTYCKSLTERLIAAGHEVQVACRRDCWLRDKLPGVSFLETGLDRNLRELRRVSEYVAQEGFDLVHTHMSRAHLFGVLLRLGMKTPVIATAHSCNFQPHWRYNDYVIANSESTLNYHRWTNWISRKRSSHIYCFTQLDRFAARSECAIASTRDQLGIRSTDYVIGVIGQVCHRKGQRTIVEALPEVTKRIPHAKLLLVGPYYERSPHVQELRHFLAQHQLEQCVIWAGATNNVVPYVQLLDLSVVPSNKEPLGLVAVESLAAGTPVIASDVGGLPEIVQHEKTGLLVPRGAPQELAAAIVRSATNPQQTATLAQAGRARVLEMFDPEKLTAEIESIYYHVSGRCRRFIAA